MRHHTYRRITQRRGEPMELLQLDPPEYGVHTTGIYIIDDEGIRVCAGPFATETAAIASIEARQETLNRGRRAVAQAAQ
jgi:hypothetical protein